MILITYSVRGIIVNGEALNKFARENNYYSHYDNYDYYFVVPWKEGGYTALKLGYDKALPSYRKSTRDQSGNDWEIKDGWDFCY